MFKLTKKVETFNNFIIKHTETGDYNLSSYGSIEEAIEYEAQCDECSEEEMSKMIHEYSPEDVLAAVTAGRMWPIKLGLVEKHHKTMNDDVLLSLVYEYQNEIERLTAEISEMAVALDCIARRLQMNVEDGSDQTNGQWRL